MWCKFLLHQSEKAVEIMKKFFLCLLELQKKATEDKVWKTYFFDLEFDKEGKFVTVPIIVIFKKLTNTFV